MTRRLGGRESVYPSNCRRATTGTRSGRRWDRSRRLNASVAFYINLASAASPAGDVRYSFSLPPRQRPPATIDRRTGPPAVGAGRPRSAAGPGRHRAAGLGRRGQHDGQFPARGPATPANAAVRMNRSPLLAEASSDADCLELAAGMPLLTQVSPILSASNILVRDVLKPRCL
jgi:hypothetical protein